MKHRVAPPSSLRFLSIVPLVALACVAVVGLVACGGEDLDERPVVRPDPATAEPGTIEVPRVPATLLYTLPPRWTEEPPANNMRVGQARIPGDSGAAELKIFYFGPGQGGGVDANIDRWLGQVETTEEPLRETMEVGELTVHLVEAYGTVTQSPMSMTAGPGEAESGQGLLGAVVEGRGGPWFIRLDGPADTVAAARDEFYALLSSMTTEPTETAPALPS